MKDAFQSNFLGNQSSTPSTRRDSTGQIDSSPGRTFSTQNLGQFLFFVLLFFVFVLLFFFFFLFCCFFLFFVLKKATNPHNRICAMYDIPFRGAVYRLNGPIRCSFFVQLCFLYLNKISQQNKEQLNKDLKKKKKKLLTLMLVICFTQRSCNKKPVSTLVFWLSSAESTKSG